MQMQRTYWLEQVLKTISLYVSALLCTLQHTYCHTRDATQRCLHFVCTALREGTLQVKTPNAVLRDAVRIIHEGILCFQMSYGLAVHA